MWSNLSAKKRLVVFAVFCWLSLAYVIAQSDYYGFKLSTFVGIGLFPLAFIAVTAWTVKGFLREKNISLNHDFVRKKISGFGGKTGQLLGAVVGLLAGKYLFSYAWLPAVAAFIGYKILQAASVTKSIPHSRTMAISVLFGHTCWMTVGAFLVASGFETIGLDIVCMSVGIGLLVLVPKNIFTLVSLVSFQLVCTFVNFQSLIEPDQTMQAAIITHIVLRTIFLIAFVADRVQDRAAIDEANTDRLAG